MVTRRRISRRYFLKRAGAVTATAALASQLPFATPIQAAAEKSGHLRFGVQTPPQHTSYKDLLSTWQDADELGYDSAFVFDHFIPIYSDPTGPCFEGWTLLSALAAQTKRVKVGVLVTGNTYRHPAVLAKMAATLDHVSGGRLILGLGAAWFELEHTAYGIPFYTPGERVRRLAEAVEVIKLLFTQEKTTFTGNYYQLKDALFEPKSVQKPHPPLLIGGMGPKKLQPLAARHADIWHFFVPDADIQKAKQTCEHFDQVCQKVGRNPAQIEKSISLRPAQLADGKQAVRDRVRALADVGIRHFILSLSQPSDRTLMRQFATDVMPAFRSA